MTSFREIPIVDVARLVAGNLRTSSPTVTQLAGIRYSVPNQWPDLPGFSHAVSAYYKATLEFGRILLRGFARDG